MEKKEFTSSNKYERYDFKTRLAFSIGEITDTVAYQGFQVLVFVFYFSVVKLPVIWISIGFVLWSVWNAVNDPIIGVLSDKTNSRWGRRVPWMMAAAVPLSFICFFLWTPPMTSDLMNFIYFMVVLFLFDTFFTMYSLNHVSLFPEMFINEEERAEVNVMRMVIAIVALIIVFLIPSILIEDMANQYGYDYTITQYHTVGLIFAITVGITIFITIKWGSKERVEFAKDFETAPPFFKSIKYTFTNRAFVFFIIAWLCMATVQSILPMLIPLYATYVLKITAENSIMIGLLLLTTFLVGIITLPLWMKIRKKWGLWQMSLMDFAVLAFAVTFFLWIDDLLMAFVAMAIGGIGIGGSMYIQDQLLAQIIDDDEINHGTRREGGFYGIWAFVTRFSGVIVILLIGIVFTGTGWGDFTPKPGAEVIWGLRILLGLSSAIILGIGFLALCFYPIHGKKLEENLIKRANLHSEKGSGK
jgi:GPH family glycoside/pentoside/hexuronide:cation symporter